MSYLDWFRTILPTWLRYEPGDGYTDVMASLLDTVAQGAEDAITCRLVQSDTVDALDYVALDRQLPRHPDLSNDIFRTYAQNAFEQWYRAGTVDGIVFCLESCGFGDITVCEGTDPFWAAVFGLEWYQFVVLIDTVPTGVLIALPEIYGTAVYGTGVYGAVSEFGKTLARTACSRFKSTHSQPVLIGIWSDTITDYTYFSGEI